MRYLIMIACLLISSFASAHMPTVELEHNVHGLIEGKSGIAWKNDKAHGAFSWDVSWMQDQTFYYWGNYCSTGIGTCDHDIVDDPLFRCLNFPDVYRFVSRIGYDNNYYSIDGIPSTMTADIIIIDGVKNYHLYRQNYEYYIDSGNVALRESTQQGLSNLRIDKYTSEINYEFFRSWVSDFTLQEYIDAIGYDKYYIRSDIVDKLNCNYTYYIETFFIVPTCLDKETWQLRLCRRESDGNLWCTSQLSNDPTTWKFYGRPLFPQVPSVFLRDLYYGQLSKSDFVQDPVIYNPEYPDGGTQGTEYWYAVATYNGNSYVFRMYGSDPPCSGVYSEGDGQHGNGKGLRIDGVGRKYQSWGGYEEVKH